MRTLTVNRLLALAAIALAISLLPAHAKAAEKLKPGEGIAVLRVKSDITRLHIVFTSEDGSQAYRVMRRKFGKLTCAYLPAGRYRIDFVEYARRKSYMPRSMEFDVKAGRGTYIGNLTHRHKLFPPGTHSERSSFSISLGKAKPPRHKGPFIQYSNYDFFSEALAQFETEVPGIPLDSQVTEVQNALPVLDPTFGSAANCQEVADHCLVAITVTVDAPRNKLPFLPLHGFSDLHIEFHADGGPRQFFPNANPLRHNNLDFHGRILKRTTMREEGQRGYVLLYRLQPGQYFIRNSVLRFKGLAGEGYHMRPFFLPFEAEAGKTIYLGNLHAVSVKQKKNRIGAIYQVSDLWDRDKRLLQERYPQCDFEKVEIQLLDASEIEGKILDIAITEEDDC